LDSFNRDAFVAVLDDEFHRRWKIDEDSIWPTRVFFSFDFLNFQRVRHWIFHCSHFSSVFVSFSRSRVLV